MRPVQDTVSSKQTRAEIKAYIMKCQQSKSVAFERTAKEKRRKVQEALLCKASVMQVVTAALASGPQYLSSAGKRELHRVSTVSSLLQTHLLVVSSQLCVSCL